MIVRDGDRLRVTVAMVMANAKALRMALAGLLEQPGMIVDLMVVESADSSALAVILEWLRQAKAQQCELQFANLPASVRALADLYGIDTLLPQV